MKLKMGKCSTYRTVILLRAFIIFLLMKRQFLLLFFILISFGSYAQFYCDFFESKSFYNRQALIKQTGYTKEIIIVKQLKNRVLEDSFKIEITSFNAKGYPINRFLGSKWHLPAIVDTFAYAGNVQQVTSVQDAEVEETPTAKNNTFSTGTTRYVYDSVSHVKKVLFTGRTTAEKLVALIFYDADGRITKVDYAPESERVRQYDYVYKKNKLKIYTVTSNSRECNEEMKFNELAQVVYRRILYYTSKGWVENKYTFTYNQEGLVETEIKKKDGDLFTIATHYYYKN